MGQKLLMSSYRAVAIAALTAGTFGAAAYAADDPNAAPIRVAASDAKAASTPDGSAKGDGAAGMEVFNGTCAHCHGPNAVVTDRRINLRRLKHKYGDEMEPVFFTTVTQGRPAKGMPSWKDVFKQQDFVNILAYLNTLQEQ